VHAHWMITVSHHHWTSELLMNDSRSKPRIPGWLMWTYGCLAVSLVLALAMGNSGDLRRSTTTLVIDNKNTIRLGDLVPLRNSTIRYTVLRAVSHQNGGQFT